MRLFCPHDASIQANPGGGGMVRCRLRGPHAAALFSSPLGLARSPSKNAKAPRSREGLSQGESRFDYLGCCCCSMLLVVGAEELLESCSRSFFSRLISTRPPLMRLVLASSSVPLTGALPMPTR